MLTDHFCDWKSGKEQPELAIYGATTATVTRSTVACAKYAIEINCYDQQYFIGKAMFSILGSICVGDKTSCGGTVSTGSPFSDVNGRAIARKGDKIACQYNCIIVDGNLTEIIDGAPMALHGAATSHGCICTSRNNDSHGDGKTAAEMAAVPFAADAGIAYMPDIAQLLNKDQWVEFKLVNARDEPIPDQPFELTDPGGKKITGTLDSNGYAKIEPVKAGSCTVHFPQLGYTMAVNA